MIFKNNTFLEKIDKKLTAWLYYSTPQRDALDIGELSDPKYIELHFPHKYEFTDYLLECPLNEFIKAMIWIFRGQYPFENSQIISSQIEIDRENSKLFYNTNKRKLEDI